MSNNVLCRRKEEKKKIRRMIYDNRTYQNEKDKDIRVTEKWTKTNERLMG